MTMIHLLVGRNGQVTGQHQLNPTNMMWQVQLQCTS